MEKSEPPIESLRSLIPKPGDSRAGSGARAADEEFVPRYVDPPPRPREAGVRNLKWGVALFLLALVLLAVGVSIHGGRALLPLIACLATFTALWICSRMRLFQQRNGVFVALALVALLGAFVPLLERAWSEAQRLTRQASAEAAPAISTAPVPAPAAEDEPPRLTRELSIGTPDLSSGKHVRVLKDSRVLVGRKPYLLKAGEIFPFDQLREGDVVFQANELRLSLPAEAVEILGAPSVEKPTAEAPPASAPLDREGAQVAARARAEAVSRYPALAQKDSPENRMFIETYQELKKSGSELLDDPGWPLLLADLLAKREGWQRRGVSDE